MKSIFINQQIQQVIESNRQQSVKVRIDNVKWIVETINHSLRKEKDNLNIMIMKIIADVMDSQNYQIYNYKQIEFVNEKLFNRVKYYFIKQNKENQQMGYVMYLILIFKIIQEEFLDDSSEENNSNFYQKVIKKNYYLMNQDISE